MANKFSKAAIYGVSGMGASSSTLTRTNDAAGLSYTMVTDSDGNYTGEIISDFDGLYPWCDMHEVVDDIGNVFIYIPKFYLKVTPADDGTLSAQISGVRYEGFHCPFIDGKGNELDYILYGKYEGSGSSAQIYSKSGQNVLVSINIQNYRKGCMANGDGYQQLDYLSRTILAFLFTIEFATLNSQSIMYGYANGNSAAISTGTTDIVSTPSGSPTSNTTGKYGCKYRGIENPWGNVWEWCDGINFGYSNQTSEDDDGNITYLYTGIFFCTDPTAYSNTMNSSYQYDAPYTYVGERSTQNGYIKALQPFYKYPIAGFPADTDDTSGASASTYYDDYYYYSSTGTVLLVGGHWFSGAIAGVWCLVGNSSATYTRSDIGGRLIYKPLS